MIKLLLNKEIDGMTSSEAYHDEERKLNNKRVSKIYTLLSCDSFPDKNGVDPYDFSMLASREVERLKILSIQSYDDLKKYNFSEFQITAVTNGISNILKNIVFFQRANLFFREIWTEPLDFCYLLPEEAIKLNKNGYYYIYDLKEIDYLDALKLSYFNSEIFSKLVYLAKIAFKKDISHNTQYELNGIVIKDIFHNKCFENVLLEKIGIPYFTIEGLHKNKIFKLFDLLNIDFSVYMNLKNICSSEAGLIIDSILAYMDIRDNELILKASCLHSSLQIKDEADSKENQDKSTSNDLYKNNVPTEFNNNDLLTANNATINQLYIENLDVEDNIVSTKKLNKDETLDNNSFIAKNDVGPYDNFSILAVKEVKQLRQLSVLNYNDLEQFNYLEFKTLLVNNGLSKLLLNTNFIRYANLFLKNIDDEPLDMCYFTLKNTKILNKSGYFIIKDFKNINYITALSLSNLDSRFFSNLIEAARVAFKKDISQNNQFVIEGNLVKDIINDKVYENRNIENIGMPYVCSELLKKNGIKYLFDLLNADYSLFFGSNGLGKNKFSAIMESLLKYLNDKRNEFDLETAILNFLKKKEEGASLETINAEINYEDVALTIESLIKTNKIKIINGKYFYHYDYSELQSFEDYLNTLKDSREKQMVIEKYSGKTLEEISRDFGLTRERVRQLISKFFTRKINFSTNKLLFKEDKYKYIYENYSLTKTEFIRIFNDANTYSYLQMRYEHGEKNLEFVAEDTFVDRDIKKKCLAYNFRNYVLLDGEYVKKQKGNLLKHYLKIYKSDISQSELLLKYNKYITNILPLDNEKYLLDKNSLRGFANHKEYEIIAKYPSIVRYYDFYSYDYDEFLETLNLNTFDNMEISTQLLFDNYSLLMHEYNILDAYELHYVLKSLFLTGVFNDSRITFGRNPILKIGSVNRTEYVVNKRKEGNYCSFAELARQISIETGVQYNIVYVDWVGQNVDAIKTINADVLTEEEVSYLKNKLTNEYYFIEEFNKITEQFSSELTNKIDAKALESIGYNYYSKIIIRKPMKLTEFLEKKILEDDVFERTYLKRFEISSIFYNIFIGFKYSLDIIEYSHNKFINIRRLAKMGYDKDNLHNLQKEIAEIGQNYDYFTMFKLKKDGCHFKIDELGFDDYFTSSIVKYSNLISNTSFENSIIFSKSNFTSGDFLKSIIKKFQKISFSELKDYLFHEYGISAAIEKIKFVLTDTDIYYDNTMETFYDSYKTYIEDL